ncbi:MAG: 3-deoxy-D-manno-octulosonic acid transferase [Bacteroidetes bacterium]|nr:3-deoxy-D-manno-octulosonic acid transferase [Bacteroidota bacterium]
MFVLYNLVVFLADLTLRFLALLSPKMKLFVDGRKDVFEKLAAAISTTDQTIWFHAASLGEYEQGLPVMEAMRLKFPQHKIILTFFSPSGYEVRKNNTVADVTLYLPLDSAANARRFIALAHPDLVFFVKYEYWPNYLKELKNKHIRTFLISGIFRENQLFFKWYGAFYRQALDSFEHFFVQNQTSEKLLRSLGKTNVSLSGDTRFDRVAAILEKDNQLSFIEAFKNNTLTLVVGSSWPKDEEILVDFINQTSEKIKWIIAPHNIKAEQIESLKNSIKRKVVLFSEKDTHNLADFDVFIIDTIGILTKIYSAGDLAYVGGGFGNPGVHNVLEPATFGLPILIGPNYSHFAEATELVQLGGCISIQNADQLKTELEKLIQDIDYRNEKGQICASFVQQNKGATRNILSYFDTQN